MNLYSPSTTELLFNAAGTNHTYQYIILLLGFGFWLTQDILSISLAYLEKTSTVQIYDETISNYTSTSLNYSICIKGNYTEVYKSGHSWVSEYEIECDSVKTGLIGSSVFLGELVGSILFQYLPDRFGRKFSSLVGAVGFSFVLLLFNFTLGYYHVIFLSFVLQIFSTVSSLSIFILATEIVSPEQRPKFAAIITSAFSFSGVMFILIFEEINNWRFTFTIASLFNLFVLLSFYKYAYESPRYYLSKCQYGKMIKCLNSIAIANDRESIFVSVTEGISPRKFKEGGKCKKKSQIVTTELEEGKKFLKVQKGSNEDSNLSIRRNNFSCTRLFAHDSLRNIFFINCYLWFSTSGIYYGLSIGIKNLPGNLYFNGIIFYSSEILSYVFSAWMVNQTLFGRKRSMQLFELLGLLGNLMLLVFRIESSWRTIFAFMVRFSITMLYNILYTYSTEVYPTIVRAKGFGLNCICGRFGGILFPLLIEIFTDEVLYMFAFMNGCAILLILFLPETLNRQMEEELEEECE